MQTNLQGISMSFKPVFSALLATAAWLSASPAAAIAIASPAVVLTPGTVSYTNVTPAGEAAMAPSTRTLTGLGTYSSTVENTSTVKRVQTAPTATTAGLAYVYSVTEATTTTTQINAYYDSFSWGQTFTGNSSANEIVTFSGTLTATQKLGAVLDITTSGSYTPETTPFGSAAPALPSFFYREGGTGAWTALATYSSAAPAGGNVFTSNALQWLGLAAGSSTFFEVAVLAGNGVDLSGLTVSLGTDFYGHYDVELSKVTSTTETLIGAEVLTPVPEPETYALFAAGLLFVVMRLRNRNR